MKTYFEVGSTDNGTYFCPPETTSYFWRHQH